ncbi:hypothetical protein L1987_00290 [Smallanthus sonchifolius]|uniref:Uncharacterized protein n=1 Tax=Smallanthus sonchifolius TaxID=185202 RepID=A0ACB9K1R2_9ASTR|nr:hypothetical protein L1987_00290 [Smallanthus sonchifolius]
MVSFLCPEDVDVHLQRRDDVQLPKKGRWLIDQTSNLSYKSSKSDQNGRNHQQDRRRSPHRRQQGRRQEARRRPPEARRRVCA